MLTLLPSHTPLCPLSSFASVHILHSSAKQKALSAESYQHFQAFWRNYRSDRLHLPVEEIKTDPEAGDGGVKSHPHEGRNL